MIPDTSQIKAAVAVLQTNPSWGIVLLLLVGGAGIAFLILLLQLLKNTEFTKAISERISDKAHDQNIEKMSVTLETIRNDQIKSNEERREQGKSIERLDSRINQIDFDMISLAREVSRMKAITKDSV